MDKINLEEKLKGILSEESVRLLLGSEALSEMLKELDNQKQEIERLNSTIKFQIKENSKIEANCDVLKKLVDECQEREDLLEKREAAVSIKENEHILAKEMLEFWKLRGDEFKELQHKTVSNVAYKETLLSEKAHVLKGIPNTVNNDGYSNHDGTPDEISNQIDSVEAIKKAE